uniref:Hypothetical secreted protein n=1 Tax=Simulium nigrimanum TaxID=683695 RepID=D1FPX2_SIMNI
MKFVLSALVIALAIVSCHAQRPRIALASTARRGSLKSTVKAQPPFKPKTDGIAPQRLASHPANAPFKPNNAGIGKLPSQDITFTQALTETMAQLSKRIYGK